MIPENPIPFEQDIFTVDGLDVSVKEFFHILESTPSMNEKIRLLKENKCPLLEEILRATYDRRINYYIKAIPEPVEGRESSLGVELKSLTTLSSRDLSGKEAIRWLAESLGSLTSDDRDIMKRVIGRDLQCGIGATTALKVYPKLFPKQGYMRCSTMATLKAEDWGEKGIYVQTKMDGMFANIIIDEEGVCSVTSRNGSTFDNERLQNIIDEVSGVGAFHGKVLHGELLVLRGGKILPRKTSNGLLNSLLKGGSLDEGDTVKFYFWDCVDLDVWNGNAPCIPYSDRFFRVVWNTFDMEYVYPVRTRICMSLEEVDKEYMEALARGEEGVVIKQPDMIWENGTSRNQVKYKPVVELDMRVVGLNEGTGKNKGTFGSIAVTSEDGLVKANTSGLTDADRVAICNAWDDIQGSIITVKANGIMKDSDTGTLSLLHPQFVEIRLDKDVADSMIRIIELFNFNRGVE